MGNHVIHTAPADMPTYEQVFNKYWGPLSAFATRILGDKMEAEDIVMDVFIMYWGRHHMFSHVYAAVAYLFVSTRNACLNFRRQTKRDTEIRSNFYYGQDGDGNILEYMVSKDLLNQAFSIVAGLPTECRRVFILCYLKGIKETTVAMQCNVSPHTIRNQKVRGLQLVRQRFNLCENTGGAWKHLNLRKAG